MPDGDIVHHRVGRGFVRAYRELCESHFSDEHVTASIAKALRKTLRFYGNAPVELLQRVFKDVSGAVGQGDRIRYSAESEIIDDTARELMGHRRGMALAVDACKEYVLDVSEQTTAKNSLDDVIESYVSKVLAADFWERMPLVHHHDNADPEYVGQRLEQVHSLLQPEIEHIVSQISRSGNVNRLRKKQQSKPDSPPDFEHMDVSF